MTSAATISRYRRLARLARAGGPGDCGHEPSGLFSRKNVCAAIEGVRKAASGAGRVASSAGRAVGRVGRAAGRGADVAISKTGQAGIKGGKAVGRVAAPLAVIGAGGAVLGGKAAAQKAAKEAIRAGKGATAAARIGKRVAHQAARMYGGIEHAFIHGIESVVSELPAGAQKFLKRASRIYFSSFQTAHHAAEILARDKGMNRDEAKNLVRVLAGLDVLAVKAVATASEVMELGHLGLAVGEFIPFATIGYLGNSFIHHPLKTAKAANLAVKRTMRRIKNVKGSHQEQVPAGATHHASRRHVTRYLNSSVLEKGDLAVKAAKRITKYGDYYHALLSVALDATRGNLARSIEIADTAYRERRRGGAPATRFARENSVEDCGHNSGGFSHGNDCAKGSGVSSGGTSGQVAASNKYSDENKKQVSETYVNEKSMAGCGLEFKRAKDGRFVVSIYPAGDDPIRYFARTVEEARENWKKAKKFVNDHGYTKLKQRDTSEGKDEKSAKKHVEKFRRLARLARAGSAEDCGHEPSGLFDRENTCAAGGGSGSSSLGGKGKIVPKDSPLYKVIHGKPMFSGSSQTEESMKRKKGPNDSYKVSTSNGHIYHYSSNSPLHAAVAIARSAGIFDKDKLEVVFKSEDGYADEYIVYKDADHVERDDREGSFSVWVEKDSSQNAFTKNIEPIPGKHSGMVFKSPNVKENMSFEEAFKNLRSSNQANCRKQSDDIDRKLGLNAKSYDAVGDWSDGAENSIVTYYENVDSFDTICKAAAQKGLDWNQKSVIPFEHDKNGPDAVYHIEVGHTDIKSIRAALDKNGISFRSIIPGKNSTKVVILDGGKKLGKNISQFKRDFHGQTSAEERIVGRADWDIGAETRTAARRKYREVLGNSSAVGIKSRRSAGRIPRRYATRIGNDHRGASATQTEDVIFQVPLSPGKQRPQAAPKGLTTARERAQQLSPHQAKYTLFHILAKYGLHPTPSRMKTTQYSEENSTDNPFHKVLADIGRSLCPKPQKSKFYADVAAEVSPNATQSASSFLGETFAGLSTGQQYGDEVMIMYRDVGGWIP